MPVQVAPCEPAAAVPPGIKPSTCQVESVGQSKTLSGMQHFALGSWRLHAQPS